MTGSTTRTKKQWRPAGLTFTLETFYKHWIGCYSNDIMWCVCLCTHGKSFAKALGKCVWVCLTLSLRSAVYTAVSQRWRLAKHLAEETEESSHRRLEQHSHTHTHSSPSPLLSRPLWPLVVACLNPSGLSPVEPVVLWRLWCVMQHKHTAGCERTTVQVECSIPPTQSPSTDPWEAENKR